MAMFPEGTRSKTGELGKAMPGALMLAAKSGAAIVPIALSGTDKLGRDNWFPRFAIRFGAPYQLPEVFSRQELDEQGAALMEKIRDLQLAQQQGD